MGKFKEIDLDITEAIYKIIKIQIYILAIIGTIGIFALSAENEQLVSKNKQIEQDRTELITENKHLQEENKALKSVVETYRIPNNQDTRTEE